MRKRIGAAGLVVLAVLLMGQGDVVVPTWPAAYVSVTGLTADDLQEAIDNNEIGAGVFDWQKIVELPLSSESWEGVAYAFENVTFTKLYCQVNGGTSVVVDLQIDDGSPASIHDQTVTCSTSGTLVGTLAGDTDFDQTNTLDLALGTVTGDVNYLTIHLRGSFD